MTMNVKSKWNPDLSSTCGACGQQMRHFFTARDYNRSITQEEFHYARCPDCGFISLANVPENMGQYYSTGYHMLPASEAAIEHGAEHERYKIELVLRFIKSGALLEIGPSWGAFCLLAKRAGFEVEAIEMDRICCDFINSKLGIKAINRTDERAAFDEVKRADAIALWHVIEHLRDPWALIARAVEQLNPNGILVIAAPNPDAFQFGIFGSRWTHVDAPRHVHLLPISLLRRKLTALGLEELLTTTTDRGSLGWNEFGWVFSLTNMAKNRLIERMLRIVGRVLNTLFSSYERVEGRGSGYTVVFRKPAVTK